MVQNTILLNIKLRNIISFSNVGLQFYFVLLTLNLMKKSYYFCCIYLKLVV